MANKSNDPATSEVKQEIKVTESAPPEVETPTAASLATGGVYPVEQLYLQTKTPASVHVGIMAHAGWYPGKLVSEAEYDAAKAAFLGGAKHA